MRPVRLPLFVAGKQMSIGKKEKHFSPQGLTEYGPRWKRADWHISGDGNICSVLPDPVHFSSDWPTFTPAGYSLRITHNCEQRVLGSACQNFLWIVEVRDRNLLSGFPTRHPAKRAMEPLSERHCKRKLSEGVQLRMQSTPPLSLLRLHRVLSSKVRILAVLTERGNIVLKTGRLASERSGLLSADQTSLGSLRLEVK